MTKYKVRRFSVITTARGVGGRKLDQDLNRLQKGLTKRELSMPNIFNEEMAKLKKSLNNLNTKN